MARDGGDGKGGAGSAAPTYRLDGTLRLNQIQVLGTHNSYHVAPPAGASLTPERDITQAPLTVQLERQSVRQIELDVHASPGGGGLSVYHLRGDEGTTCPTLVQCLSEIREWSASHRGHLPLFVLIEPKHELGALVDGLAVDAEIRSVLRSDQLLTPDEVQGGWSSLRQAVQEGGWPLLGSARNKIVFVYTDDVITRLAYTSSGTSLQGRAMFVYADPSSPLAAFASVPDARLGGARIAELVRAGYIVRDACRRRRRRGAGQRLLPGHDRAGVRRAVGEHRLSRARAVGIRRAHPGPSCTLQPCQRPAGHRLHAPGRREPALTHRDLGAVVHRAS